MYTSLSLGQRLLSFLRSSFRFDLRSLGSAHMSARSVLTYKELTFVINILVVAALVEASIPSVGTFTGLVLFCTSNGA